MSALEQIVAELKTLPSAKLEEAAQYVHQLRMRDESSLSARSTALHLAIGLFVSEDATLGQAADVAGLSQAAFLRELGARRIPIHYGMDELAEDLRAIESLPPR